MISLYLKTKRILFVLFHRMDFSLCIYHLFVWLNLNFLHKSQWVTFPIQSCLVLYSLCAKLLHTGILNTCTRLWLTESEQATLVDSIKDIVRSSVKVPEFDKHLKKAGGHIGRNVVETTIKMKTIVRKPLMIKNNLILIYLIYMYKQDSLLDNLQGMICHKKPTNQPFTVFTLQFQIFWKYEAPFLTAQ